MGDKKCDRGALIKEGAHLMEEMNKMYDAVVAKHTSHLTGSINFIHKFNGRIELQKANGFVLGRYCCPVVYVVNSATFNLNKSHERR